MRLTILATILAALPLAAQHDSQPPVLTAIAAAPDNPICTATTCPIVVTWSATDNMSGVAAIHLSYTAPDGLAHADNTCTLTPANTVTNATCTVTLPRFAQAGPWQLTTASLWDTAGNAATAAIDLSPATITVQ